MGTLEAQRRGSFLPEATVNKLRARGLNLSQSGSRRLPQPPKTWVEFFLLKEPHVPSPVVLLY
jgi:hypothetical protein